MNESQFRAYIAIHGQPPPTHHQDELDLQGPIERKWPARWDPMDDDPQRADQLKGVESEPWETRPKPQGKQPPLGRAGAFQPTDAALHALRLSNPHLNDYEFRLNPQPAGYHAVDAIHAPSGSYAGRLDWRAAGHPDVRNNGATAGEVNMVEVKDQHRGRGLATAMWDFANFHATREGSRINAPVHSEVRSIEGNHWAHFVGGASMARTGGFGVQKYGG